MSFSMRPEEYQERLLTTLNNDSAIIGRRIAFWERDLANNDYTAAQRELKVKELEDEKDLQNLIDTLASAVADVEEW